MDIGPWLWQDAPLLRGIQSHLLATAAVRLVEILAGLALAF
jgi:hypothetical protein